MGNGASIDIVQEVDVSVLYQRWLDEPIFINSEILVLRRNVPSSWIVKFQEENVLIENLNDYINFILLRLD